jgi:hypothetical protein
MTGQAGKWSPVPFNHLGHQFGHDDLSRCTQCAQSRSQREAHAKTSDKDPGPGLTGQSCAGEFGQRIL